RRRRDPPAHRPDLPARGDQRGARVLPRRLRRPRRDHDQGLVLKGRTQAEEPAPMDKLIITVTCDSTMSYPHNPNNPTPHGLQAVADEYIRGVEAGASICHIHGPYTVDVKIQPDGTKLSDLDIPGWARLRALIEDRCKPIMQYGIANGRFPQRKELMKQRPDMMSICFNAHDECFENEPGYPPVELYGLHNRDE